MTPEDELELLRLYEAEAEAEQAPVPQQPQQPQQQADKTPTEIYSNWMSRLGAGMRDPILGGAQFVNNAMPDSMAEARQQFDKWLYDKTNGVVGYPEGDINAYVKQRGQDYQAALPPDEGIDEARMIGQGLTSILATRGLGAPKTLLGAVGQGAAIGAGEGAAQPVTEDDYWSQKRKDIGTGTAVGGALGIPGHIASRMIAPKGANNADIRTMENAGVKPTVGQTLGGGFDTMEQKATSIPIMGDAIAMARQRGRDQFNQSIIDKTLESVDGTVKGAGTGAVSDVHKLIQAAYTNALDTIPGIKIDGIASKELSALRSLARNLPDDELRQFNRIYKEKVLSRLSPAGGMTSRTFKEMDSDLGKVIRISKDPRGVFKELQNIFRQQGSRISPKFRSKLKAADEAFAKQVRLDSATNAAGLQGGVFTPGQMVNATKKADQSIRKNQFSQGDALLQDYATTGQRVLGDKYPDSGSAGRYAMMGGGSLAAAMDPASAATALGGLLAGAGVYTPVVQDLLRSSITRNASKGARMVGRAIDNAAPSLSYPILSDTQGNQ